MVLKRRNEAVWRGAGLQNDDGTRLEQAIAVVSRNNGGFQGSYASFHARIRAGLPPTQSPNLFTLGPAAAFLKQAPFTV